MKCVKYLAKMSRGIDPYGVKNLCECFPFAWQSRRTLLLRSRCLGQKIVRNYSRFDVHMTVQRKTK
jgi:hypothetical protein